MYRKANQPEITPNEFKFSNQSKLSAKNRWVIMAELMPWQEFEEEYAKNFPTEKGAPAKTFRMALGSLIIKEKLGLTDRETVEQIRENPYLQYFIGLTEYQEEVELDASSLVNFGKGKKGS
jgi:transposase, IS5 family